MDTNPFIGGIDNPDPDFLRILAKMPEPPFGSQDEATKTLTELNALFVKKRQAAQDGDSAAFDRITDKEVRLLENLED